MRLGFHFARCQKKATPMVESPILSGTLTVSTKWHITDNDMSSSLRGTSRYAIISIVIGWPETVQITVSA